MVRAKFQVTSVEPNGSMNPEDQGSTITLFPVVGGSPENDQFYKWTPGGQIILSTINAVAAAEFVPGKQFYVDFTPAEA